MKLTQTIKEKFIADVLTGEVIPVDFAERIDKEWKAMIAKVMPIGIASIYTNPALTSWVNPTMVESLRMQLTSLRGHASAPGYVQAGFEAIDRIEMERAAHYRNIDNIRDAIVKVCDSVTTVLGVAKMLPQYEKYLPKDKSRVSRDEAKIAAQTASAAVKVANVADWRAKPAKPAKKAPAVRRSRAKKPAAAEPAMKALLSPSAAWPFPSQNK